MEQAGGELEQVGLQNREPGIYTLLLHLDRSREIKVGSLNSLLFPEGYYSYTGSARGPGGLKRVKRHLRVLEGVNPARRWHIDYILPYTALVEIFVVKTRQNLECSIARRIGEAIAPVKGFGCTDCRCVTHLHYSPELNRIKEAVSSAYAACVERSAAGQPVQTDVSEGAVGPKL
jgi:Uri superfamily endonuclease